LRVGWDCSLCSPRKRKNQNLLGREWRLRALNLGHCHSSGRETPQHLPSTRWSKGRVPVAGMRFLKIRRTNREAKTVALGQCRSRSNGWPTKTPEHFARGFSGHSHKQN
jgi:hypothetical protein